MPGADIVVVTMAYAMVLYVDSPAVDPARVKPSTRRSVVQARTAKPCSSSRVELIFFVASICVRRAGAAGRYLRSRAS